MRRLFNVYRCPEPSEPPQTGLDGEEGEKVIKKPKLEEELEDEMD